MRQLRHPEGGYENDYRCLAGAALSLTGPFIDLLALPPTPTGGNTDWNGSYTETIQPNAATVAGAQSFTATLVVTSPTSFAGTMTLENFVSGGDFVHATKRNICDVSLQYSAVFTGSAN